MKRILAVGLVFTACAFAQRGGAQAGSGPRTSGDSIGPYDKQIVDAAAATRGRGLYVIECVDCHGPTARGVDNNGPNLIRSNVVIHDRAGSQLGPFLKKGHPLQSKGNSANLTNEQVVDLTHFLKQRIDDALKRQPMGDNINIITGDAAAGKAYFDGAGKCGTCHSLTGDLAGLTAKYPDPVNIQQAMLFPGGGRGGRGGGRGAAAPAAPGPPTRTTVMVTVTPPGGQPVTGALVMLDDFDVQLRDASGMVQSFTRTPAMKVVKNDPLTAHHQLLDVITNKNMHDLVVYLETAK